MGQAPIVMHGTQKHVLLGQPHIFLREHCGTIHQRHPVIHNLQIGYEANGILEAQAWRRPHRKLSKTGSKTGSALTLGTLGSFSRLKRNTLRPDTFLGHLPMY